jgi:hypothetical protein
MMQLELENVLISKWKTQNVHPLVGSAILKNIWHLIHVTKTWPKKSETTLPIYIATYGINNDI